MRRVAAHLTDLGLAGAVAAVGVAGTGLADAASDVDRGVDGPAFALVLVASAALAARRRRPLPTLAVATLATSAYLVAGYPYGPILLAFLIALYTVARHLPLATAVPAALAALAALLVHVFVDRPGGPGLFGLIPGSAWVVVPFTVGVSVRLSRESARRARAEAVRQRVYEERLHLAQEVHDVVGHGLAAIKMQADVALHVLGKKPEQAEVALRAISRTSTEALGELRATLAVVRRPAPGLSRLGELCARMGEAGVRVGLRTHGTPRDLPAAVDAAGYRVVREALTNVLRHGGDRFATVTVGYETDTVLIMVVNPATGGAAPDGGPAAADGVPRGLGIPGMRERVTSLGGQFTAGHTGDGRFEVRARMPTGEAR